MPGSLAVVLLLAAWIWSGCSLAGGRKLPPLPELAERQLSGMEPAVRQQVKSALGKVREKPHDAEANGRLGMILEAYDLPERAIPCYERARLLDPKAVAWAYYLATSQAAVGADTNAVVALLREVRRLDPGYLAANLRLAETLLASGETAESRTLAEALLVQAPDSARVQYLAGRTRAARGEHRAAVEHYRRACELAPRYGQAHYALGLAYNQLGDKARAEEQLSLFRQGQTSVLPVADPLLEKLETLKVGGHHHLNEGKRLHDEGRLPEALVEYQQALQANPRLLQAHVNLISVYGGLGNLPEAEKHYKTTLELDPNNPDSHYNYGLALSEQKRFPDAERAFRKSVELDPSSADAYNNLGYVLESQGRLADAENSYQRALAAQPNHREAHLNAARLLEKRGKFPEAIEHLHQTLWLEDARTPTLLYYLGDAYARSGNRERATYYWRESARRARALGQTELAETAEKRVQAHKP